MCRNFEEGRTVNKKTPYPVWLLICFVFGGIVVMLEESLAPHPPEDVVQMLEQQKEVQHAR